MEFKNETEFKKAVAQAIIDSGKSSFSKTVEDLVPLFYSLAILGVANEIMLKCLSKKL